ncbi:MAG: hypothetical protein GQ534_04485 [Candidatus Delongbacteria bacterium]|nr:hypothetical protein [Candidatus Delongbacteria bacterium]
MEENNKNIESIDQIKAIMERSTTFVSLSGLSGILSGILAIIGVYILYVSFGSLILSDDILQSLQNEQGLLNKLYIIFSGIFLLAIMFAFILSYLKSKKKGQKLFNSSSKRFAFNLFIPIITAIFVVISLINHHEYWLVIPMTLIFYGIALINAGKYSRQEILDLGIGCIFSGVLSMYFVEFSFILWGIGFGILNILTGITMYYKYDRN